MTISSQNDLFARRKIASQRARERICVDLAQRLGNFADWRCPHMGGEELLLFEEFLTIPDYIIQAWLTNPDPDVPNNKFLETASAIKDFTKEPKGSNISNLPGVKSAKDDKNMGRADEKYLLDSSNSKEERKIDNHAWGIGEAAAIGGGVGAVISGIAGEIGSVIGTIKREIRNANRELDDVLDERRIFIDLRNSLRRVSAKLAGVSGVAHYLRVSKLEINNLPIDWGSILNHPLFMQDRSHIIGELSNLDVEDRRRIEADFRQRIKSELEKFTEKAMDGAEARNLYQCITIFFGAAYIPSFEVLFEIVEVEDI